MRLASPTSDSTPEPQGPTNHSAETLSTASNAIAGASHRACAACHEVWPGHLLEQCGERFLCKPCRHNAETEAKAPKRPSYVAHLSADTIRNWGIAFTLLSVAIYMGVRITAWNMVNKAAHDVVEGTQSWAKKPAAQWPALAMAVSPGSGVKTPEAWQLGPNACLVQRGDGSVACISAVAERANLASLAQPDGAKAIPEAVTYQQFSAIVRECELSAGNETLGFKVLLPDTHGAFDKGLVFFTQPAANLPKSWPLFHIREGVYVPGMKMTVLVRNPKTGAQEPLEAMVASNNISSDLAALATDQLHDIGRKTGDGSESLITLNHPYSAEALIGAPVVDVRGNLAAIVTMAYSPTNTEGLTTDFVAFGMHALKSLTVPAKK